jgi:hypothetical protein
MSNAAGRNLSLGWRVRDDREVLQQVRDIARTAKAPGIAVVEASVELREDFDTEGPAVVVVLALTDPAGGQETWDVEALQSLLDDVRRQVAGAAMPYDLVLLFKSATPETSGDDDPDSDLSARLRDGGPSAASL